MLHRDRHFVNTFLAKNVRLKKMWSAALDPPLRAIAVCAAGIGKPVRPRTQCDKGPFTTEGFTPSILSRKVASLGSRSNRRGPAGCVQIKLGSVPLLGQGQGFPSHTSKGGYLPGFQSPTVAMNTSFHGQAGGQTLDRSSWDGYR